MKQHGFTLVELVVIIGILSIISAILAQTFVVVTRVNSMATSQNKLVIQTHTAANWISGDVESALKGSVTAGTGNTLCSMRRYQWNGADNITDNTSITYQVNNNILTRQVGSNTAQQIAQFILASGTTFAAENVTTGYYDLTVTASDNSSSYSEVFKMNQLLH